MFITNVNMNIMSRSVIKVNGGDTEESTSLFPSHLLDKLPEENADKVVSFAMNECIRKQLNQISTADDVYMLVPLSL